ncbi:MAG: cytosolic protein [Anaerolineaceae bacterium]|nr:cytosolic protein [Anaerolineaceae bacterium]
MTGLDINFVNQFVNENIVTFHENRLRVLNQLNLQKLIKKNPYLFKAKNLNTAGDLIEGLLTAFLSSSEEKMFGDFLEDLAIFISTITSNGRKSSAEGIDLEFERNNIHYIVSIKSGPNWGNSSQHKKLAENFITAKNVLQQSQFGINVQSVLGICYGKTRTSFSDKGYLKTVGQNFWYLISQESGLYIDIIEPIGFRAKQHNEAFESSRAKISNRFTREFIDLYCRDDGSINWETLVQYSCGNLDLDTVLNAPSLT